MLVNTEVFVRAEGLWLGWQMETLLYSSLTVAHLETEDCLEIRCIPDMHRSPCLPLGKTFAGSCCALQLQSCSLFPFPAKLSEWKMGPLIIPFPQPHPLHASFLPPVSWKLSEVTCELCIPKSSDIFFTFILLTFPQHLTLSITVSLAPRFCPDWIHPLVLWVVSTLALKHGLSGPGFVPLLFSFTLSSLLVMSPSSYCFRSRWTRHLRTFNGKKEARTMAIPPIPAGCSWVSHVQSCAA